MVRVRFAPSPTGSLHLGGALTAVANRNFADEHLGVLILRIDDTDASRTEEGSEAGILRDLDWLGVPFEEGPVRQSERSELYRAAADRLVEKGAARDDEGPVRFRSEHEPTLLRADG
ncbi:MAG TPA: glutamate--tRNA ligase family protein, partial [Gaiellaceae bacterium]|nr:glutamate--tRNA ligase family protein [Gaiellaceae bacterium]